MGADADAPRYWFWKVDRLAAAEVADDAEAVAEVALSAAEVADEEALELELFAEARAFVALTDASDALVEAVEALEADEVAEDAL